MPDDLPTQDSATCPLCRSTRHTQLERYSYEEIWRLLRRQLNAEFSADVVANNTPAADAQLLLCGHCGLQFFNPTQAADEGFYKELMRATPYLEHRWEFGVVADLVEPGQRVVDFGCGDGGFLRSVGSRAGALVGVDLNPDVGLELPGAEIAIHTVSFSDFALSNEGAFDVVCAFQVIEHLEDVAELILPASRCLDATGRLFVSVPNVARVGASGLEPLDLPPHHVSRWGTRQLEMLAEVHGLHLRRLYFSPPLWGPPSWEVRAAIPQQPALRRVATKLMRDRVLPRRALRRLLESPWYGRHGIVGHGLLGEFVLASASRTSE